MLVVHIKSKAKPAEKDKDSSPASSLTMDEISVLLDEHRAALATDFKSSFYSLSTTLVSIKSTIADLGQKITSLEENATVAEQRLQKLESLSCSLKAENESLKAKVADLEGRSRCQNIRIIGLPEQIEELRPNAFFSQLLVDIFGAEILALPPRVGPSTSEPHAKTCPGR